MWKASSMDQSKQCLGMSLILVRNIGICEIIHVLSVHPSTCLVDPSQQQALITDVCICVCVLACVCVCVCVRYL